MPERKVELAYEIKADLGECPRWDEKEGLLYWVDINNFHLHRFNPKTGENDTLTFEEEIGCFSLRKDGGFVLAMRSGFHLIDGWNTNLQPIADPEADLQHNRFNDGRCDAAGRLIAGSYYPPKDIDGANLWSLGEDLEPKKLVEGLLTSNGAAFSPDNKIFYLSDTPKHTIWKFDYNLETGELSNRQVFCEFPQGNGRPDGASVDAEGYYWSALYEGGRVVRISPEGEIVEEIAVPAKCPTMVAFGGDDLKTLFITTVGGRPEEEFAEYPLSGSLFKVEVDVPGVVEHRFFK